jgi:23S rRNA pseudouridine2605 synthase
MRINKYLARSGVASRRRADKLILQGRVKINGRTVNKLGLQVSRQNDIVEVDGKVISPETGAFYIMLNKPPGCLVSTSDPHHKKLVISYLKDYKGKVFPVGRLDYDSSGLLLFTNDGLLAFRLNHPRYKVEKTYEVECEGIITKTALKKMQQGIMLEDGPTAPAKTRLINHKEASSIVHIAIHEGRKRQVRRMFKKIGYPVLNLKRIAYGSLKLGNLAEGSFRPVNKIQLKKLQDLVGLR